MLKQYIIIGVFVIALLFYVSGNKLVFREGFMNSTRCPNVLIQKGKEFFLFNTKVAKVPGVNPIQFETLEDYKEFMEWQRSQGIKCPILYVQQGFDAQGNQVYQQRPDPFDPQGGLGTLPPAPVDGDDVAEQSLLFDAARSDPPYNQNMYPSFDPMNQYIGLDTPLDQMNADAASEPYSGNAMDPNWSGPAYTQQLVHQGYYKDNEVSIYIP
jgi:hypothetical protein